MERLFVQTVSAGMLSRESVEKEAQSILIQTGELITKSFAEVQRMPEATARASATHVARRLDRYVMTSNT